MENWITTDSDNLQFKMENTLHFKEFNRIIYPKIFEEYKGKKSYELKPIWDIKKYWIEDTIDLTKYSLQELLIHSTIHYSGLDELICTYEKNSESILAECIFEQENELY